MGVITKLLRKPLVFMGTPNRKPQCWKKHNIRLKSIHHDI